MEILHACLFFTLYTYSVYIYYNYREVYESCGITGTNFSFIMQETYRVFFVVAHNATVQKLYIKIITPPFKKRKKNEEIICVFVVVLIVREKLLNILSINK